MAGIPTITQTSAGGVAYRRQGDEIQVALISVGEDRRWQLPKGQVDSDEPTEKAALREVREEAGVVAELVAPIEKIDYWFYSNHRGQRARIHKFVYFYLLRYLSGDPKNHDHEVNEARWVEINGAIEMLAFESEIRVLGKAKEMIEAGA